MKAEQLRINQARLLAALDELAAIGRTEDGSCCRLALTDEDKAGRDLVVKRMRELGLEVRIDPIGNIFGRRAGREDIAPVVTGSHIDTVRTGGRFDGCLGVLGGLEVVRTLNGAGIATRRPLVVAVFTDEEGARFHPDMAGSLAYVGGLPLQELYDTRGIDGKRFEDELRRIGYLGDAPIPLYRPHAYVELHIEQGPVLDIEGITIGAVENLQGISWQEVTIVGQSNHAGTTPMRLRHDAGYCAAAIGHFLRQLARDMGGNQVATMGKVDLHPNLINVIAARAKVTVDLRNTDEALLKQAEQRFAGFLKQLAADEGVKIETRSLARFEPVIFDQGVADLIARTAQRLGHSCRPMTSGAGHDAQMIARIAPTAMIFVPSIRGISHNPAEDTKPEHLAAGADVLLHTLLELAA
ncbi:M20 family metallo-hydrolase [Betaproteobacteria bacterium PRO7]|jgi:N-carbamoyl-L-amino-acid hydrolase|nr:M20 family metallo-hydrolase [Betaproteobacteria bacterium PRO7]